MDFAAIFGTVGALFSITHLLPELALAIRSHHLNDVSWGMLIISQLNFLSWFAYGILTPAHPIIFAAGVNTAVIATLIGLKYYYALPKVQKQYQRAEQKKRRQANKAQRQRRPSLKSSRA